MPVFRVNFFHHVECDGIFLIGRIEINDVVYPVGGNRFDDGFGKLAVRINDCHAPAAVDILYCHILDHGGFSGSGFPDNIKVPAPIVGFDSKNPVLPAEICFSECCDLVHFIARSLSFL